MVKVDPRRLASAAALAIMAGSIACSDPAPEPTKVTEENTVLAPPRVPERTGPFRNPRLDAPLPRGDEQLPEADLRDAIKRGLQAMKDGDENGAIRLLKSCANKVPQSGICEGELALILLPKGNFKAEAEYYLDESCASNDERADAAFYKKMGDAASKRGRHDSAIKAYRTSIDKGDDSADAWIRYAGALQGRQARIPEAAEALARAIERDPERHQMVFDRAVLLAQLQEFDLSVELMGEYLEKTRGKDPKRDATVEARIAELEGLAKAAKGGGGQGAPAKQDPPAKQEVLPQ